MKLAKAEILKPRRDKLSLRGFSVLGIVLALKEMTLFMALLQVLKRGGLLVGNC